MKKSLSTFLAIIALSGFHAQAQGPGICSDPISGIIDRLWESATEGELLTANGRRRISGSFLSHDPWTDANTVRVMSNFWGPAVLRRVNSDEAEVELGYEDAGTIDAKLRYTRPKPPYVGKIPVVATSSIYRLKLADTHWNRYKSDGKTIDRVMTGPAAWQIEGPPGSPWTTVNTAIRYVLERRAKAKDPEIRTNADRTIAELLKRQ